jgi:hypothetical protein
MPLYEVAADRDRESRLARALAIAWSVRAVKLPHLAPLDWYFRRNHQLVAWAEIKARPNRDRGTFPTVFLNYAKVHPLFFAGTAFGCPAFFIAEFHDGAFGVDVRSLVGLPCHVRGRLDRGDAQDVEPCIEIPIAFLVPAETLL